MFDSYSKKSRVISIRRTFLALAIGIFSTFFNYPNTVDNFTGAALWFAFLTVGSYILLTAMSVILARIQ